ncbi:MAG: glutaminase A [Thermomicrobiales bacterium]|nr:glutaminase A [Thermomicrobiales bacterium]
MSASEMIEPTAGFVSTGQLPPLSDTERLVAEAYSSIGQIAGGEVSGVYPALSRVSPDLFGIALVSTSGDSVSVGDANHPFTIMSISKPFVFALVCDRLGPDAIRDQIGVNATGRPFNSVAAVEESADGRTNPMVNSGAIATTSLVPGASSDEKWRFIQEGLERFAGRSLPLNDEVYQSASETNFRNRGIANTLFGRNRLYANVEEATDLYTRQCSLDVTAFDLAVMGATLANGGVNPITGDRVVSPISCHHTLVVMTVAGLYETSGDWLYEIGLPGKSGIGGGIVTVSPGKGGLGTFAPPLDGAGNSVKGQLVARSLSRSIGLDLFLSGSAQDA